MDGVMQIITELERRRRWSVRDKLPIVGELADPDASACGVASRYSVCESLVFTWRRELREGVLVEQIRSASTQVTPPACGSDIRCPSSASGTLPPSKAGARVKPVTVSSRPDTKAASKQPTYSSSDAMAQATSGTVSGISVP